MMDARTDDRVVSANILRLQIRDAKYEQGSSIKLEIISKKRPG